MPEGGEIMNSYMLQLSKTVDREVTAHDLGQRARVLRKSLGLSVADAASKAGVPETDYVDFERYGNGTVAMLLAVHRALSRGDVGNLLSVPRFEDIDEYANHLKRRTRA